MGFSLTATDRKRLKGAHPDLRKFVLEAARVSPVRFRVNEVCRSMAKQREYVRRGVSWTYNSRHLNCHAADLVPIDDNGQPIWSWPTYYKMEPYLKQAAKNVGVPIEWGGDWRRTKDGPHWQLPWKLYPSRKRDFKAAAAELPPDDQPETEAQRLKKSRTMRGAGMVTVGQAGDQLIQAGQDISMVAEYAPVMHYAMAVLTIAGVALIIYARWDDAGRPSLKDIFS
jgi:peptidoglycan LD-endopeptidase CwlK